MGNGASRTAPLENLGRTAQPLPITGNVPASRVSTRSTGKTDRPRRSQPEAVAVSEENIPRQPVIVSMEHGVVWQPGMRVPPAAPAAAGDGQGDMPGGALHRAPRAGTDGIRYHPRMNCGNDNTDSNAVEPHKLYRVLRGPKKYHHQALHFIIAKGDVDSALLENRPTSSVPQGKGYNWPETFRNSLARHFVITFPPDTGLASGDANDDVSATASDVNILSDGEEDSGKLVLSLQKNSTVADVNVQLALHFLQTAECFELHLDGQNIPLSDVSTISSFAPAEQDIWGSFVIQLTEL